MRLPAVPPTHAHQDHPGGLAAILDNFRVSKLWIGREVSSLALARLEELARQRKIPIEQFVASHLAGMASMATFCGRRLLQERSQLQQRTMIRWYCGCTSAV